MPGPFVPITNKKTGKSYQMPWADTENPPSEDDVRKFVYDQENPGIWKKYFDTPLTDLPSQIGRTVAEPLNRYGNYEDMSGIGGEELKQKMAESSPFLRSLARGAGAYTEGLGDAITGTLSPVGIATTYVPMAAGAARLAQAPRLASGLSRVAQAGGAAQFGHGGIKAATGDTLTERGLGLLEAGGGALGVRAGGRIAEQAEGLGQIKEPLSSVMSGKFGGAAPPNPMAGARYGGSGNSFQGPFGQYVEGEIVPPMGEVQVEGGLARQYQAPPPPAGPRGMGPTPPAGYLGEGLPPKGPFYGGREGVSPDIHQATELADIAETPAESAFWGLIPDRFKPKFGKSNVSVTGATEKAPYKYVPPSGEGYTGTGRLEDIEEAVPSRAAQTQFKKDPINTMTEAQLVETVRTGQPGDVNKASRRLAEEFGHEPKVGEIPTTKPGSGWPKSVLRKKKVGGVSETTQAADEPADPKSIKSMVERLKAILADKKGGSEKGFIKLDTLLPNFKGTKADLQELMHDPTGTADFWKKGWTVIEQAGDEGKQLARFLKRNRYDIEAELAQAKNDTKATKVIWERHGDQIKNMTDAIKDPKKREKVQGIVDTWLGRGKAVPDSEIVNKLKKVQAATKLSRFVINNTYGLAANYMRGNVGATTRATVESLSSRANYKKAVDVAEKAGIFQSLRGEASRDVGKAGDKVTGLIDKFFSIGKSEEGMRTVSAIAGRDTANQIFQQLKRNPANKLARARLDDLLLEDVDKVLGQSKLSDQQLNRASASFVDLTQGRAESIDLPRLWSGHPYADLVTQFKRYSLTQSSNMISAFKRDPIRTAGAIGIAFPAVGEVLNSAKDVVGGVAKAGKRAATGEDEWSEESVKKAIAAEWSGHGEGLKRYTDTLSGSWAFGLIADALASAKRGPQGFAEFAGGPTVSDVSQGASAVYDLASKGRPEHLEREIVRKVPYVGVPLAQDIQGSYAGRQRRRSREKRARRQK